MYMHIYKYPLDEVDIIIIIYFCTCKININKQDNRRDTFMSVKLTSITSHLQNTNGLINVAGCMYISYLHWVG